MSLNAVFPTDINLFKPTTHTLKMTDIIKIYNIIFYHLFTNKKQLFVIKYFLFPINNLFLQLKYLKNAIFKI